VRNISRPLGAEISDADIPLESVAFLRQARPEGNLLNAYPFGGYLIAELPEYPVALDGREHPFAEFRREEAAARVNGYAEFLRRWNINVALQQIPSMTYNPQAQIFSDSNAALFPPDEWAQVFFDNVSVVYARRSERNRALIEQYEYHSLRRGLPANFGANMKGLGDADRAAISADLERCLAANPRCVWCMVGKAAFAHSHGDDAAALQLLDSALAVMPRNPEVLLERSVVLEGLGRSDEAAAAKRDFERLTRSESQSAASP
jgi:hypothetical protein